MLTPSPSAQYTGDGTTTSFTVPFSFVSRSDIQVFINGTQTYTYSWTSNGQISISPAPAAGVLILVARHTVADTSGFNFQSGALRPADLNNAMRQVLYVAQEAYDTSSQAESDATAAVNTANSANAASNTATATANSAVTTANSAVDTANQAVATSNTATTTANSAVTTAGQAVTTANGAVITANQATTVAQTALEAILTAPAGTVIGQQDGTGALVQTLRDKTMRRVDVSDFCVGIDALVAAGKNPDETAGFADALATAAAKGAALELGGLKVLTGSATIPPNVTVRSDSYPCLRTDSYYNQAGQIRLQPGATLTVSSGVVMERLTILPAGLTFPTAATAHDEATLEAFVNTFAGTAITVMPSANDCLFRDLAIFGFDTGILAALQYGGRLFFDCLRIDCLNGIKHTGGADISHFNRVHCWAFTTTAYAAGGAASLTRRGTAFYVGNNANIAPSIPGGRDDWTQFSECFTYGFYFGYVCDSASNVQFLNCQVDGCGGNAAQVYGFSIVGDSYQIRNTNPTVFNHQTGVYIGVGTTTADGANPRAYEQIGGYIAAFGPAIDVNHGNVFVSGKPHLSGSVAVQIEATAGYFDIDLGQVDGPAMMFIDPAWAQYGRIIYPTIITQAGMSLLTTSGGVAISAAQQNAIACEGALPVLGAANNISLRPVEIRSSGPELVLYNSAAANSATATFDILGGNDGTMALRQLNLARTAAVVLAQLTAQGPVFPALPVAASDSAAAALSPAVPVGGLYKTSAGVVMQRTS